MARTSRVPTFMGSDRALARYLARPISNFLHLEVTGGLLLLVATAAALIWANSPWDTAYQELWHTEIEFTLGTFHIEDELLHVVNDGLMAIFFFVVGLEIKRELVVGELREPRSAILPTVAAIGGMVVPAAVYAVMNAGGDGSGGWGIPMATDIAFALGVVSLLGRRVPATLKLFLLSLAIVDDIGAIGVIAIFFTEELSLGWLGLAVVGIVVMYVLRRLRVWYMPVYVIVGVFVWLATFESGIHATIAGVVLGLLTPARPLQPPSETRAHLGKLEGDSALDQLGPREVRATAFLIRESMSVAERLEHAIHPWTSYVIIPIFALANAGIALSGDTVSDAATSAPRRRPRPGGGQGGGDRRVHADRRAPGAGLVPRRHAGEPRGRRGVHRRHRLHGVVVHRRARVRHRGHPGRSEGRHPRRLGHRGDPGNRCSRVGRPEDIGTRAGGGRVRSRGAGVLSATWLTSAR